MTEIDLSVVIETPTGPLELNDRVNFEVASGWGHPGVTRRRTYVVGRYQSGRRLTEVVDDSLQYGGAVRIMADDWPAVEELRSTLFAALSQFSYEITETLNGVTTVFECEPADITPARDGIFRPQVRIAHSEWAIQIPINPPTTEDIS